MAAIKSDPKKASAVAEEELMSTDWLESQIKTLNEEVERQLGEKERAIEAVKNEYQEKLDSAKKDYTKLFDEFNNQSKKQPEVVESKEAEALRGSILKLFKMFEAMLVGRKTPLNPRGLQYSEVLLVHQSGHGVMNEFLAEFPWLKPHVKDTP